MRGPAGGGEFEIGDQQEVLNLSEGTSVQALSKEPGTEQ